MMRRNDKMPDGRPLRPLCRFRNARVLCARKSKPLDAGTGEPALLFLHYYGGSARTWSGVTSRLSQYYRCVAYDQRGWGLSDAPPDGYAIADLARDASEVIRALQIARYVLVGHSMGGKAAQLLASQRPEGLEGVVLVAPAAPTPQNIPEPARQQRFCQRSGRGDCWFPDAMATIPGVEGGKVRCVARNADRPRSRSGSGPHHIGASAAPHRS
jgi:pimeloyl-ACP methyl ester carboxylesterase